MVAVGRSRLDAGSIIKMGVSALIGYTFYDQLNVQVIEIKKASYYNETNCKAYKVADLNNIPEGVKPMAYEGLMFLYDLVPLGLGLLFLSILNEAIKTTRSLNGRIIDTISNEILSFSIGSLIGIIVFRSLTPNLSEVVCKIETSDNPSVFGTIAILFLKFWPLVVAGGLGVFNILSSKKFMRI